MKIPFFHKPKSSKELEVIRFVIKEFGYKPQRVSYFIEALTHKSAQIDSKQNISNERLEFLGDAIISSVVAEYLFKKYIVKSEISSNLSFKDGIFIGITLIL